MALDDLRIERLSPRESNPDRDAPYATCWAPGSGASELCRLEAKQPKATRSGAKRDADPDQQRDPAGWNRTSLSVAVLS